MTTPQCPAEQMREALKRAVEDFQRLGYSGAENRCKAALALPPCPAPEAKAGWKCAPGEWHKVSCGFWTVGGSCTEMCGYCESHPDTTPIPTKEAAKPKCSGWDCARGKTCPACDAPSSAEAKP